MARWGRFDFREFERLKRNYEQLAQNIDTFLREFLLEMAMRAERKIKKRTPVDTGLLRRSWEVGEVIKQGDKYLVEIINPVEYASYVEYGHRTRDRRKWVDGRFMMTISMQEIERELPRFLERRLLKWLKERKVS